MSDQPEETASQAASPPTSLSELAISVLVSQLALLRTLAEAGLDVPRYNRFLEHFAEAAKVKPDALAVLRLRDKEPPPKDQT